MSGLPKLLSRGSDKVIIFTSNGYPQLPTAKKITVSVTANGTTNFTGSNFAGTGKSVKSEASYEVEQSHTFDLCNCEFSKTYPFTYQATYQRVCLNSPPPPEEAEWEELSETIDVEGEVAFMLELVSAESSSTDGFLPIGYSVSAFVSPVGFVGGNPPFYPDCYAFSVLWFGLDGQGGVVTCTDKNVSDEQEITTDWGEWYGAEGWSGQAVEKFTVNVTLE